MAEFPSEIMYDILSRLPVKSLARFRCVSKLWFNYINDSHLQTMHAKRANPMLITFHQYPSDSPNSPCELSFLEHLKHTLKMPKKQPAMEFMCRNWDYNYPKDIVLGSCNGLLYSSQGYPETATLVVIHPLRRECYEVPPMDTPFCPNQPSWYTSGERIRSCVEWSCGLGFDDSTNTYKMVCVVPRKQVQPKFDPVKEEYLCTMVHVLGTSSWRNIPQVPSYPIIDEGVFANGCLHWLAWCNLDNFPIIKFDMKTEKFKCIKSPRERNYTSWNINVYLVDLHGQLGFVYTVMDRSVEVWVLNERRWAMHCKFEQKPPLPNGFIRVLGFWNENGDILVTDNWERKGLCVYNLTSDTSHKVVIVGLEERGIKDIRMYQSSLLSAGYSIKYGRKKRNKGKKNASISLLGSKFDTIAFF